MGRGVERGRGRRDGVGEGRGSACSVDHHSLALFHFYDRLEKKVECSVAYIQKTKKLDGERKRVVEDWKLRRTTRRGRRGRSRFNGDEEKNKRKKKQRDSFDWYVRVGREE